MNLDHTIPVNMESPHLEPDKELSLEPRNIQAAMEEPKNSEAATEQPKNSEEAHDQVLVGYRCGLGCMWPFEREPPADGKKLCYICGDDDGSHEELRCPFNYMYYEDTSGTCEGSCSAGKHPMAAVVSGSGSSSGRRSEFLRCVVRVNNYPTKFRPFDFYWLCNRFGPMRMYHLVMRTGRFSWGFGYAIFSSRQHAESAIETLNGATIRGRKLRVDWAYPCI